MPPPPITSRSNARVKALRAAFHGKAAEPGDLVGLEGLTLLTEALQARHELAEVFVRQGSETAPVGQLLASFGVEPIHLAPEVFDSAMHTHSPQGIAALLRIPSHPALSLADVRGVALIVESLQDPGNLGTLLRSAEAFGAEAVFLAGDAVNPWNPKCLRASAGSVFRIPVLSLPPSWMTEPRPEGLSLYAAVAHGANAQDLLGTVLRFPCAFLLGNEGAGVSPQARAAASECLRIPCATESLNVAVAGSVLLYEAARQRSQGPTSQAQAALR